MLHYRKENAATTLQHQQLQTLVSLMCNRVMKKLSKWLLGLWVSEWMSYTHTHTYIYTHAHIHTYIIMREISTEIPVKAISEIE